MEEREWHMDFLWSVVHQGINILVLRWELVKKKNKAWFSYFWGPQLCPCCHNSDNLKQYKPRGDRKKPNPKPKTKTKQKTRHEVMVLTVLESWLTPCWIHRIHTHPRRGSCVWGSRSHSGTASVSAWCTVLLSRVLRQPRTIFCRGVWEVKHPLEWVSRRTCALWSQRSGVCGYHGTHTVQFSFPAWLWSWWT